MFKGDTVVISASPEINFMVENWNVDGVVYMTAKTKTFADIGAEFAPEKTGIDVEVVFGAQTYSTVTYTVAAASSGETVSAKSDGIAFESGSNSVGNGSEVMFTAVPNAGNMVEKWVLVEGGDVSDYALDAMGWATASGLIGGLPGGILDSAGNASSAEVAAVLHRFIELIVLG